MDKLYKELNIKESTKTALQKLGIETMTEIQSLAIPEVLNGLDIIAQAQTGTGKTFAFAVPILEKIKEYGNTLDALVICPTRELANQVFVEFNKLNFENKYKITAIYGGDSYQKQFDALKKKPQVVIATPGRVIDHIKRGTIDFSDLKTLVLDEADEMLKMGFLEDLETIFETTPKERQTVLFSATMPKEIKKIAANYQKDAKFLKVEKDTLTVDKIEQKYYMVKKKDRNNLLLRLMDYYLPESAIIFCNTKSDVDNLTELLQKKDYQAEAIHGDLSQSQREIVMKRFREKRLKYLVATDVAARGIDVKHVDYVINYELPFENELYVHRIGRTGRAGKKGVSLSFAYPTTINRLRLIERYIKTPIKEEKIPEIKEIVLKQKDNSYQKIVDQIINNNNKDYLKDFRLFIETHNFTDDQIINGLIANFMTNTNDYNEIEAVGGNRRNNKDNNKNNKKTKEGKKGHKNEYVDYQVNIGSNEGIKPPMFLDYVKKHADIFPRNIGDIKINKNQTVFGVNKNSTKRIEKLNNKFLNGKQLKLKRL